MSHVASAFLLKDADLLGDEHVLHIDVGGDTTLPEGAKCFTATSGEFIHNGQFRYNIAHYLIYPHARQDHMKHGEVIIPMRSNSVWWLRQVHFIMEYVLRQRLKKRWHEGHYSVRPEPQGWSRGCRPGACTCSTENPWNFDSNKMEEEFMSGYRFIDQEFVRRHT